MYSDTVTIFNFYESSTITIWYPRIISGADLSTDIGAILKKYGTNSTDKAELHITYILREGRKIITNSNGAELSWLPPKEWKQQEESKLSNSITFGPDDFFMEGVWEGGPINEDDYPDGFYGYMNSQYDFVYRISAVGGPYAVIPHFEILGK